MFDHVTFRVADRSASERFYQAAFVPLAIDLSFRTDAFTEWGDFSLAEHDDDHPVTAGVHVAFAARSREQVDDFWRELTAAGFAGEGDGPALRTRDGEQEYAAGVRDPDGHVVEAVVVDEPTRAAVVHHLGLGVADLAAATRFYAVIAPPAGLRVPVAPDGRSTFRGRDGGTLTLTPAGGAVVTSANVHLAFGTTDDEDVAAFHRLATEAGFVGHGAPGERPQYHAGYYAAYALDPGGNNVEVVNHHRPEA